MLFGLVSFFKSCSASLNLVECVKLIHVSCTNISIGLMKTEFMKQRMKKKRTCHNVGVNIWERKKRLLTEYICL